MTIPGQILMKIMEFIDDVEGLSDILKDEEKSKDLLYEEFPGLIRIRKKH